MTGPVDSPALEALAEVLALLDRLDESGQNFDTDLIRGQVPDVLRRKLAGAVADRNDGPEVDSPDPGQTPIGRLLFDAANTHRVLATMTDPVEVARTTGEVNGMIRALALQIDAPLYAGHRYGRLTGSSVWRALWDAVSAIVGAPGIALAERVARFDTLAEDWPAQRAALIGGSANNGR